MSKDLFLVIDMQNVYTDEGKWCCPATKEAALNIKRILQSKKEEINVIFTRFLASSDPQGVWKEYNIENQDVNEDAFSNEMMAVFQSELEEYPLYTKSTYSSLAIPEVQKAVKESRRVVVAGVVAECCVLSTVMSLIDEGIPVVYLTDAVAGIDKDTESAVELILSGLEPLHVQRMTVEEYLDTSQ
ncbi:MAG: isochorismatase family protein [Eubacteriales bacterium]|nr:isochorismatase family protein [Eubacteriales bacterium]